MAADNILGQISAYPFRSPIPKNYLEIAVDHIHTYGQALKNRPEDLGIMKYGHCGNSPILYRPKLGGA
jgi:hypothetical protein